MIFLQIATLTLSAFLIFQLKGIKRSMSALNDAVQTILNDVTELQAAGQRILELLQKPNPDVDAAIAALQNAEQPRQMAVLVREADMITLPTTSDALLEQLRIHRDAVNAFDAEQQHNRFTDRLLSVLKHLGGAEPFVFSMLDELDFINTFDKAAELYRLDSLEAALRSGIRTLQFAR